MSSPEPDNWEYPYAARSATTEEAVDVPPVTRERWKIPWRSLWRWTARAATAAAVLLLLFAIAASIPVYRAARQAWLIAELERRGCQVSYWHEGPDYERLGDRWWSEVRDVWADWHGDPTAADVRFICDACRRFPRLHSFIIDSDHFSCEQFADWPQLDRIEYLTVKSSKLSDADLAIVGRMEAIQNLTLGRAKIGSNGIGALARLPSLESLTLDSVSFNGSGLDDGRALQALQRLTIVRSPGLGDDAVICLGLLPQLEFVELHITSISDQGLDHLLRSGKVRSLTVSQGKLTDSCMAALREHAPPYWIALVGMPLTDACLEPLTDKQLSSLAISGTSITDEGFRSFAEIQGLEYLDLSDTKVTGTGVRYLKADHAVSHLDLSGSPLTPEAAEALAKLRCSELVLSRTPLDDQGLMLFVENDSLRQLDVTDTQVTLAGAKAFYEARKKRRHPLAEETLLLICDYPELFDFVTGVEPAYGMPGLGSLEAIELVPP